MPLKEALLVFRGRPKTPVCPFAAKKCWGRDVASYAIPSGIWCARCEKSQAAPQTLILMRPGHLQHVSLTTF